MRSRVAAIHHPRAAQIRAGIRNSAINGIPSFAIEDLARVYNQEGRINVAARFPQAVRLAE